MVDGEGQIWTGVDDGRIVRISPESGETTVVGDTGGRPLGLHVARDGRLLICDSPRGLLAMDPRHRRVRDAGRRGGRPKTAVLLERHRNTRRRNLFHRVDERFHLRRLHGGDLGGARDGAACSAGSGRHRGHARVRPVFRQRADADRGRVRAGVRRAAGTTAVEVPADRTERRDRSPHWPRTCPACPTTCRPVPTAGSGARSSHRPTRSRIGWRRGSPLVRKLLWRLPSRLRPKPESVVWVVAFDPETGDAVAGMRTEHPGFGQVTGMVEANGKLWMGSHRRLRGRVDRAGRDRPALTRDRR